MSLLAILTLVVVGLIVAALAVSLVAILVQLRRILSTLGKVNVGLRVIAERVQPLEPILAEVNGDLAAVRDRLAGVLRRRKERV
ncbi:MAG TPA: hypothetical protein VFD04_06145 [Actinomycetes bacterium]|nr:hypothetical protein [Actinomycetes bacterium]